MNSSGTIPGNFLSATVAASAASAPLPCWCGAGRWTVFFRTRRFGLLQCSACGCFQTDPPPLRAEEDSAEFYTDYYSNLAIDNPLKSATKTRNAWFWKVAGQVSSLTEVKRNAVDIGSGDGHFCAELAGAGWPRVIGIEISQTRVARARNLYPQIQFYSCPLAKTGIAENSLDLIVMDSVIEHLPNPAGMIHELRRYLVPGGSLVILTPNMTSGHFRFLGRRWTGMLAPHAHIFLYTSNALSKLLTQCGFLVSQCGSLHTTPYTPLEYLRRLLSGDLKGTVWRAHQEIGGLYGRLINAGPMLYGVAVRPD